jgi:hypothetical protein
MKIELFQDGVSRPIVTLCSASRAIAFEVANACLPEDPSSLHFDEGQMTDER